MKELAGSHIVSAIALISLGVVLLIIRLFGSFAGSFWPLFVIASGVALLALASSGLGRGGTRRLPAQ